jgi:hypothetical protein
MKNQYVILKGVLTVSLIVLLVGVAVNHRVSVQGTLGNSQVADGVPLPPPVQPPPKLDSVIIADGVPLPPPVQPPPKQLSC